MFKCPGLVWPCPRRPREWWPAVVVLRRLSKIDCDHQRRSFAFALGHSVSRTSRSLCPDCAATARRAGGWRGADSEARPRVEVAWRAIARQIARQSQVATLNLLHASFPSVCFKFLARGDDNLAASSLGACVATTIMPQCVTRS